MHVVRRIGPVAPEGSMCTCSMRTARRSSRLVRPDARRPADLAARILAVGEPVTAAIESMTGARSSTTSSSSPAGTSRSPTRRRRRASPRSPPRPTRSTPGCSPSSPPGLVPAIWLPDPSVRAERERAHFRLHLVRHRTALKNRIHATLITFGHPVPVSDLFGSRPAASCSPVSSCPSRGRPPSRRSLDLVDELERQIERLRGRAAGARCRPPVRPAARDRSRHRLGPRLHDRRRDRRHRPLPERQAAHRLHRPLPTGVPVGRHRPPRTARQDRPQVPALGAHRGGDPRRPSRALRAEATNEPSAGSASSEAARSRGSSSPASSHRDLVHAHAPGAVPGGRPP